MSLRDMAIAIGFNGKSAQKELEKTDRLTDKVKKNMIGFGQEVTKSASKFKSFEIAGKHLKNTGRDIESFGSSLTRKITLPATAAATAVGGMVAVLGWGRLKAMDAAKAKLQGLGYATEDVARISEQVKNAVRGTTMTMAEGTSVAAGALAAGIAEGANLEKYIRQVGDAAVGSGRDINSMAQIFNRVQGMGKLMTQELNMVEDGMPGFAMAMSKALGVSQGEFRKMVTDGKVSSAQFLAVMDDFAGEMSASYAQSWTGMVSNTKAYIGIVGESLLGGVFEQSKDSVAEFLEFLRSDEVQEWATRTGKSIGDSFSSIVGTIKGAIGWFTSLDSGTRELLGKLALAAVAAGPIISVVGKVTAGIGGMVEAFGKIGGAIKSPQALGALLSPGGLIVLGIAAIVTAGVLLYKNWDKISHLAKGFKEKVVKLKNNALDKLGNTVQTVKEKFTEWEGTIKTTASVLGVVFGPALIRTGVTAAATGAKIAATFVASTATAGIKAVISAGQITVSFIASLIQTGVQAARTSIVIGAQFVASVTKAGLVAGRTALVITGQMLVAMASYALSGWRAVAAIGATVVALGIQKGSMVAGAVATGTMTAAQWALNFAMTANPIGLIIVGIGLLIGAIALLWKHSEGFRGFILNLFDSISKGLKGMVSGVVSGLNTMIGALNRLKVKVPDWVPNWGGKQFSLNIPRLAEGTNNFAGGVAMVGEVGPELVHLPRGSQVTPAGETRRMLSGSYAGGGDTFAPQINITIEGGSGSVNESIPSIKREVEKALYPMLESYFRELRMKRPSITEA